MTTTLLALKTRKTVLRSCTEIEEIADGAVSEKTMSDYELILTQLTAAERQLGMGSTNRCEWLTE